MNARNIDAEWASFGEQAYNDRRDAERYRMLRARQHLMLLSNGVGCSPSQVMRWNTAQSQARLDDIVDAARARREAA